MVQLCEWVWSSCEWVWSSCEWVWFSCVGVCGPVVSGCGPVSVRILMAIFGVIQLSGSGKSRCNPQHSLSP